MSNFALLIALFAVSTFCLRGLVDHGAGAALGPVSRAGRVASVSGMSGTGAGIGTIVSTFLIGCVADRYSFEPILIAASLIPLVATFLVLLLVRPRRQ